MYTRDRDRDRDIEIERSVENSTHLFIKKYYKDITISLVQPLHEQSIGKIIIK